MAELPVIILRLRTRRNVFILILIFTILFYLLSKWLPHRTTYRPIQYDQCLQENLDPFMQDNEQMNAIFNHEPLQYGELVSLPFTGNGYVGLSLSSQSHISLISENRSSFLSIDFSPVIRIVSSNYEDSRAVVLQTHQGLVRRFQCFKINEEHSAYVTHLLYAHRQRSSLIVQEIHMINPSDTSIEFDIEQRKSSIISQEISFDIVKDKFQMITNEIAIEKQQVIVYVVITNKQLSSKQIKANSQDKLFVLTVTKYSPPLSNNNKTLIQHWQRTLQTQAKTELSEALAISPNRLLKEHVDIWSSIWQSGFSISRSLAPSVMNGDVINRTIYYVLASTSSPIYDNRIEEKTRSFYNQSLFQIDHCYESHSTLVGNRLWRSPGDDLAVSQLSNLWKSTLAKKGCASLMRSGVNGVLQSMLLSIGGIRFRNHHLEMNLDPKELHRDMFFRSIHFGKEYYLNISISVGQDNRAVIDVTIDNEQSRAYACDAGCLDAPVQLSTKSTRFPVKMTSPSTAILYITEDVEYMHQLKDTLHVKEVEIAPPHAHDILALHRHGHKLGGLPIIFWIALVVLIIIFHLFLLKIVLNEMGFFKHTLPTYSRPRAL